MPPPKFNKLTNSKTGKLRKINPPAPVTTQEPRPDESAQQFELEICWCVQQLETSLQAKGLTPKQGKDVALLSRSVLLITSSSS